MTRYTHDKWDHRFLDLAHHISGWSKDPSTKVGACIVRNNRIVSLGFNGFARGVSDVMSSREQKLARTIHAEANALHFAAQDVTACKIYVTHAPCSHCAAHIIQRGISWVVYDEPGVDFLSRWSDSYNESLLMFHEAGVLVLQRKATE